MQGQIYLHFIDEETNSERWSDVSVQQVPRLKLEPKTSDVSNSTSCDHCPSWICNQSKARAKQECSVLVSFFWQPESKASPGPRCTALSVRSLFLGTPNRSAERVLTFLLAALVRIQHLLSAYSIPGTVCGTRSKSDKDSYHIPVA